MARRYCPDLAVPRGPGRLVVRLGNVPGNVGATAGGGVVVGVGESVGDVVVVLLLVPLSFGRPMSVVDSRTVV